MRQSILAAVGISWPLCPVLAVDNDPTNGWGQFGLMGLLLLAAARTIQRFMDHSLAQQDKATAATIEQHKAQTQVMVEISQQIQQSRMAAAALDARITKHMDDDDERAKQLLDAIRDLASGNK